MTSHLVLCPGCGYSFWTTEFLETIESWESHCIRDDGYDYVQTGKNRWEGTRTDRDVEYWPWLVDNDAIDAIAMPELYPKLKGVGPSRLYTNEANVV